MWTQVYTLPIILFGVYAYCLPNQQWANANNGPQTPTPQNATADSLVYGYPLTQFVKVAGALAFGLAVNTFSYARELATADVTAIVRPNEDTLYSTLAYDLSHGDVIVNLPDIPEDQYHLTTFYDPFGNILANVGSGHQDEPGRYYLRKQKAGMPIGLDNHTSDYNAYVNSPSVYGLILMRLEVNSTNLKELHMYQNGTTTQNVSISTSSQTPYLTEVIQKLQSEQAASAAAAKNATVGIMALLAAFTPYSPPLYSNQAQSVDAMLKAAGISAGHYAPPPGVDLGKANATAEAQIEDCLYPPGKMTKFANGWSMITPKYLSPNFGTHYAVRASVARYGYTILTPPNTIYPAWTNTTAGQKAGYHGLAGSTLSLEAGEALLYDFIGGVPPLQHPGFWSLTIYDENGYLIPNAQNTYRLGDRDHLTYADSNPVYPPTVANHMKPFQILVQAADVAPPANWTTNWLPSPSTNSDGKNAKSFTVFLRFYGATEALNNGKYTYPSVTKTKAITDSTVATCPSTEKSKV